MESKHEYIIIVRDKDNITRALDSGFNSFEQGQEHLKKYCKRRDAIWGILLSDEGRIASTYP